MTNQYPATCRKCGGTVPAGEGFVSGGKAAGEPGWRVVHEQCIAGYKKPQEYDL